VSLGRTVNFVCQL